MMNRKKLLPKDDTSYITIQELNKQVQELNRQIEALKQSKALSDAKLESQDKIYRDFFGTIFAAIMVRIEK